jgi:hypothetical protein
VADSPIAEDTGEAPPQDLGSLAPSRDDTLRSLPEAEGETTYPGSGRERTEDPGRSWPRTLASLAVVLLVLGFRYVDFGSDEKNDAPQVDVPEPPAAVVKAGPEVVAYLGQVEALCRAHDALIAAHPGEIPVDKLVRSETRATSEIAAVPAPPDATEMRRAFLKARRGVDEIAMRTFRLMSKSSDQDRTEKQLSPTIRKRVDHMYGTFASFGVYCNINSQPGF